VEAFNYAGVSKFVEIPVTNGRDLTLDATGEATFKVFYKPTEVVLISERTREPTYEYTIMMRP